MKQSRDTGVVLAETLLASRAAVMGQCLAAEQPKDDVPGASEDAATASARGPCPAVRDAGTSRAVGDLRTPLPTQTDIERAEASPDGRTVISVWQKTPTPARNLRRTATLSARFRPRNRPRRHH